MQDRIRLYVDGELPPAESAALERELAGNPDLQSRVQFLLRGRLIRTASLTKHPGDRPAGEYLALARRAGFVLVDRRGIFPTVPVVTRLIRRHPRSLLRLHRWLTRLLPVPGWCFLNLLTFRKR